MFHVILIRFCRKQAHDRLRARPRNLSAEFRELELAHRLEFLQALVLKLDYRVAFPVAVGGGKRRIHVTHQENHRNVGLPGRRLLDRETHRVHLLHLHLRRILVDRHEESLFQRI